MTVMIPEEAEVVEGEIVDSPSAYRNARDVAPPAASGNGASPQRQSSSAGGPSPQPSQKTYHRWVMAEFVGCIVLVGVTPLLNEPKDADGNAVATQDVLFGADALIRLSALCVVFFILSLLSNHEKSGKFAAAFGGLIMTGILINTSPTLWKKMGSLFGGDVGSGTQPQQSASQAGGGASWVKAVENAAEKALKQIIPWG
jgi:hypothetical protein